MKYIPFLSIRFLRRRLSGLGALLAVTFGVAALFTVLAVMEGYKNKMRELIRGQESHLILMSNPALSLTGVEEIEAAIRKVPQVTATAPFIETVALYRSFGRFSHFKLKGLDPLKEAKVGDLASYILREEELTTIFPAGEVDPPERLVLERRVHEVLREGRQPLSDDEIERLFSLEHRMKIWQEANPNRTLGPREKVPAALVVGINLLLDREVFLGDEVSVIALSPNNPTQPLTERFLVVGAFKSGEFENDTRAALMLRSKMQTFLELYDQVQGDFRAEGIRIALRDYRDAPVARRAIIEAVAAATAGSRLPEAATAFRKAAASLTDDALDSLAAQIEAEWGAGPGFDQAAARRAIGAVAAQLAEERKLAFLEAYMIKRYPSVLEAMLAKSGGSAIAPKGLLYAPSMEAKNAWLESVASPQGEPLGAASSEVLAAAARTKVCDVVDREVLRNLDRIFPPERDSIIDVHTWEETRQQILIEAVDREKWIVGFLILLINAFIGCVVLLMLVLLVIEKTRDMGVLMALGATPRGVISIFLADGLAIVAIGTVLGLVAGHYFTLHLNTIHDLFHAWTGYRLFDPEIYKLDRLPASVSVSEVLLSVLPSIKFGLVASLIPAIWASRQDPIKAIHYE